jgi:hypothetical protein
LYYLGLETLTLTLPYGQPFFQHHFRQNILHLLNKDFLGRPSATRAKEIFENYCRFLEHPFSHQIITADHCPTYDQFHAPSFNTGYDAEDLGAALSVPRPSSPVVVDGTSNESIPTEGMSAYEECEVECNTILNAIEQEPSNLWLWLSLGQMCLACKQYSYGISLCKQGKRQYPSIRWPDIVLSCMYSRSGQAQKAIDIYMETFEGGDEMDEWRISAFGDGAKQGRLKALSLPVGHKFIQYDSIPPASHW